MKMANVHIRSICLALSASQIITCASVFGDSSPAEDLRTKEDVIVISASRIETSERKTASSVSVISHDEIVASKQSNVLEILKGVAGLDVVQSGGLGGNTSIFLRGANSEHTLVLIDGVEANNPIDPTRAFNFADLPLDNIERIEVLRGPQSTLYGSEALGGVIDIITRKGRGDLRTFVEAEAGSYSTFNERAGISAGSERGDFSLAASRQDSNGISSAGAKYGNSEKDGYENSSVAASGAIVIDPQMKLEASTRYVRAHSELDNEGGVGGDDPNRRLNHELFFSHLALGTNWLDGRLTQDFSMSYSNQEYHDDNDVDAAHLADVLRSDFRGRLMKFEHQTVYKPSSEVALLAGLETEQERGSSDYFSDGEFGPYSSTFLGRSVRNNAAYTQVSLDFDNSFFATAGIRVDHHAQFGEKVTWRIAPGILLNDDRTKLFTTVGSGYKAPSLFQLYSDFGNIDLKPEESTGVDAGVEQKLLGEILSTQATFFFNDFSNLISFNNDTFKSENIKSAETKGIEWSLDARPTDALKVKLAYTYTDSEDRGTGAELVRRPKNKVSTQVHYMTAQKTDLVLEVLCVGKATDTDFSTGSSRTVNLGGHTLVNAVLSQPLSEHLSAFVRVNNVFDKEYENVFGFGTPGLSAFAGLRFEGL